MLQAIRSQASSFIIKILFGLLIVSFGVWGIGDIFRSRTADTTVATVGSKKIDAAELNQAVHNEIERYRSMLHSQIDMDQAKQFGIVDNSLQSLINADLVNLELGRLQLAVGNPAIKQWLEDAPQFKNDAGKFDPLLFANAAAQQRMTEAQYWEMLRDNMVHNHLAEALSEGVTPPRAEVDALYSARAEHRVADYVVIPPTAIGTLPAPTEDELAKFYDSHKEHFRVPELRSFTIGLLRVDDIAASLAIPDDKLEADYKARMDEFHTPEQRELQQMVLPDEAKAKEAAAQLATGKDFATVAKDIGGLDASTLDLGWITRTDKEVPAQLLDAAFALPAGGTTEPIQTAFGWHIVRVAEIRPETTQSFEDVKAKLRDEAAHDQAADQISKTANAIDDAVAGGASFADVADKFALKTQTVSGVAANGDDADGKAVELPQPGDAILKAAFSTEEGQTSPLAELGDTGYFLVKVDKKQPSAIKPLTEVHDQVVQQWQAEQREAALARLADDMVKEIAGGKSVKDVAAAHKLTFATSAPLLRTGGDAKVPPALVAKLFSAKLNGAASAPSADGQVVAELTAIQPADPAKDATAVKQLSDQLGRDMTTDVFTEYSRALRSTFPVEINKTNLDRLL
jgi:peptidyl-prolyl cis-trans isomerase D